MTHQLDVAQGRKVVARWCALAEQRLEYLTELFETGRWRRFHTERAFLENIREAKSAVAIWRDLSLREASLDNNAIDLSWLDQTKTPPPHGDLILWPPAEAPVQLDPTSEQTDRVCSGEAPSVPAMDEPTLESIPEIALDIDAIERRYPLLRNTL